MLLQRLEHAPLDARHETGRSMWCIDTWRRSESHKHEAEIEVHFSIKPQNFILCAKNSSCFKKGIVDIRSQHTVHPKGVHAHGTDKGVDLNLGMQIISWRWQSSAKFAAGRSWNLKYWLLVTVTGWYLTKRPMHCENFLIYCAPHLRYNHSRLIHQISLLWLQQRHLVAKRGRTGWEMATTFFPISVSIIPQGSLTRREILEQENVKQVLV
jgi:hypothetical protein